MKTLLVDTSLFINQLLIYIEQGKQVTIPARGISMRPFIEDGRDQIVLGPLHKTPQVGDVVLAFVDGKRYVIHRLVALRQQQAVLRGDGNVGTEQCRLSDIKARAEGFVRKGALISTHSCRWRAYSQLWCLLLPLRRYILAVVRRAGCYR